MLTSAVCPVWRACLFFRLLNANKIACLRVDAFQDLHNLNLLSLYDNKLQTIAKGTFSSLRAIQTLYVKHTHLLSNLNSRRQMKPEPTNQLETSDIFKKVAEKGTMFFCEKHHRYTQQL